MKKNVSIFSFLSLMYIQICFGATTATQNLTMSIASSSNITTSGNPATLAITINSDGTGSATDNSTTYTVVCNSGAKGTLKITGQISSGGDMPENTSLKTSLASTAGTSLGAQTLSTTAVDLVNKLPTLLSDRGTITYTFDVTNGWTMAAQTLTRTVTLTLTSGS